MQTCLLRGRGLCFTERFSLRRVSLSSSILKLPAMHISLTQPYLQVLHHRQQGYYARRAMCAAQQQQPFDGSSTTGFVWTRKTDKVCCPLLSSKSSQLCLRALAGQSPQAALQVLQHVWWPYCDGCSPWRERAAACLPAMLCSELLESQNGELVACSGCCARTPLTCNGHMFRS